MKRFYLVIPDFSIEKSASSGARGRSVKFDENLTGLAGYPKFCLPKACTKWCNRKIRDTLQNRQNPRRILSYNPFGANFAIAKFGIILLLIACLLYPSYLFSGEQKKSMPHRAIIIPKKWVERTELKPEKIKTETQAKKNPASLTAAVKMLNEYRQKLELQDEQIKKLQQELKNASGELEETKTASGEDKLYIEKLEETLTELSKPTPTYIVNENDCLWKIAAKPNVYNDASKWLWLYHANRDQVYDPNLIFPNMVLTIPQYNKEFKKPLKNLRDK